MKTIKQLAEDLDTFWDLSDEDYLGRLTAFAEAYHAQKGANFWISLKDRLPTIGQKVWVGRNGIVPAAMEAIFDGTNYVDPEQYGWEYANRFLEPTHWQPEYRPAPPISQDGE